MKMLRRLPSRSSPALSPPRPLPGLCYAGDHSPGLTRKKRGKQFHYTDPAGRRVQDAGTLRRIRSLAIPPAWTRVWISPDPASHLQATGRDARGRKQYRYHPQWRKLRDANKFDRMVRFGQCLPVLRQRVQEDLAARTLTRNKVVATVVSLLEKSLIRVGNDEYVQANGSYGLTTLQDRHAAISSDTIHFRFTGKSGVRHQVKVRDRRLAGIVRKCQELPGQELFQYLDENGKVHDITSSDVNAYLRDVTGEEFTAKDFRTWAGTVLAAMALQEFEEFDSHVQARKNILLAIERVAARLGNTPTVCRKSYIHPRILDAYLDRSMLSSAQQSARREMTTSLATLPPEEAAVLALLEGRLATEAA